MKNFPKVSVIVPVFNAEKFLGVCLESVLIQTLKDFEVIVVDDCSTDSSFSVAESFLEKFGGRLKIISLPKNTGSAAVPRNVGLEHAHGEYIFFVDADDLLTKDALETLYDFAEKYSSDVVYTEKCFMCDEKNPPKNFKLATWSRAVLKNKIFLETEDTGARVNMLMNSHFYWPPWTKFVRRGFLVDNNIKFPRMKIAEDMVWTIEIICAAKNLLRVPTPLYVYRENETSMMSRKRTTEQQIIFWTSPLINGLDCLDKFMRRLKFFQKNSVARLQVLNFFALSQFDNMAEAFKEFDPTEVYEIFLREFSKADDLQPALIAYLLVMNNLYRNELRK